MGHYGPDNEFETHKLGRHVRKGERALTLCMPETVKRPGEEDAEGDEPDVFTRFIYRSPWFVLAQTEGQDIEPAPIPSWDRARALAALGVEEVPFDTTDGNVLGFARARSIAINPVNLLPYTAP